MLIGDFNVIIESVLDFVDIDYCIYVFGINFY